MQALADYVTFIQFKRIQFIKFGELLKKIVRERTKKVDRATRRMTDGQGDYFRASTPNYNE